MFAGKSIIRQIAVGFALLVFFTGCSFTSYADEENHVNIIGKGDGFSAVLYDNTNGLPTSEANAIAETEDGFIWIGGYSGLVRYDGNTFLRLDSTSGIASVVSLCVDSKQRLWIGTNDSGVVIMSKGKIEKITKADGLTSSSVRSIIEDPDGYMYLGTTNGITIVSPDNEVLHVTDDNLSKEPIRKLVVAENGNVYGITKSGAVFVLNNGKLIGYYTAKDVGIEDIYSISPDASNPGYLYFGTKKSEIYYGSFDGKNFSIKTMYSTAPLEYVNVIKEIGTEQWVCADNGLGILKDGRFYNLSNLPIDNSVEDIMTDYQGNLWVASSKRGVMKIVPNQFADITHQYGLPETVVNTTCVHKSMLFIGSKNEGLTVIGNGRVMDSFPIRHFMYANGAPVPSRDLISFLETTTVKSIVEDSKERLWFSTYGNDALICYKNGTAICYRPSDGLPSDRIKVVYERKDGKIMVVCTGGLAILDGRMVERVYNEADGIENTELLTGIEAENGDMLVGSDGGGIFVINDDGVRHLGIEDGLASEVIMRIKKDTEKDIYWIVTSNSLAYMDADYNITTIKQFPYSNNFDLYEDDSDNMWILSSNGIYVAGKQELLDNKTIDPLFYDASSGLPCITTGNSNSALTENGDLYISGSTGVCRVNINKPFEEVSKLKVTVPYIECDGKLVYADADGVFNLEPNVRKITISGYIFTYSLMNPQVTYYLEGFDKKKNVVKRSEFTSVDYTNVPGGTYEFKMQIKESRSEAVKDFSFTIIKKKAFYEYVIVRAGLSILGMVIAGFLVWRIMHITIISRQYEQIRAAKEDAERANSAKSRFLANMSHEIRTPINTIMGMDEMILREDTENVPKEYADMVTGYAHKIKLASETLLGLVNDLLDLSKIEAGKMELIENEYDTQDLFQSLAMMIRVRSNEKDLVFKTKIDEQLPKKLYGDSVKLKEVLLNLLTNAVKYTKEGGFTLIVSVVEKSDDKCVIYYGVEDTGIGVKPEDINKLFTAFQRVDEGKNTAIKGTGLGLDISRQFVELMGGSLSCESIYGEGSTFSFKIKQKIADPEPIGEFIEKVENKEKRQYIPGFVAPCARIMVVDDNEMNLQVVKGLLKATKVNLTLALSGRECLEELSKNEYHLILLDHMMPEMDGIETLEKIRITHPDIPVIALTANVMNGGSDYYIKAGFQDYLSKPVEGGALEQMIKRYLPSDLISESEEAAEVQEEVLPEYLSWLYEIDGISVADGIMYCGNAEFFEKFLTSFYESIDEKADEISNAFEKEDYDNYTIKVHALKSTARIIGAAELSHLAEELEMAGKSGNISFIKANTDKLITMFKGYKLILEKLSEKEDQEAEDNSKPEISGADLSEAFAALKEFIPQMDYDAMEMVLEDLDNYKLSEESSKIIAELKKLMKKLDWEKMEELISNYNVV